MGSTGSKVIQSPVLTRHDEEVKLVRALDIDTALSMTRDFAAILARSKAKNTIFRKRMESLGAGNANLAFAWTFIAVAACQAAFKRQKADEAVASLWSDFRTVFPDAWAILVPAAAGKINLPVIV